MIALFVMSLSALSVLRSTALAAHPDCSPDAAVRSLSISFDSKRNESGDWVDSFAARTVYGSQSGGIAMDVTHRVVECDGKRVVYIQGVSRGNSRVHNASDADYSAASSENKRVSEGFRFHPRHGRNLEILDNGLSAQKKNIAERDESVAFTNRPLNDDEKFEIRIHRPRIEHPTTMGFGIVTKPPAEIKVLSSFFQERSAWMIYHNTIYSNHTEKRQNYGRKLEDLEDGDKIGVVRKQSGFVHFFVNGVDQGAAVSGISGPVYGVVDLWNMAQGATIVDG